MKVRESDQMSVQRPGGRPSPVALVLLIGGYILLGVVYSVSVPILEAPDEMWHLAYVRYLVKEHHLPPWDHESPLGQESSQPPLYYTTAALATAWFDSAGPETLPDRNPHWGYPSAGRVDDNKNLFFHEWEGREAFPWRGTALVVHVARFVNLIFGALTVASTYLLAHEIFPQHAALAMFAAALVAFNPQFLFISSAVNNDAATGAFSAMTLWLLVGGLRRGYTSRRVAMLGGTAGLAALSKVSALALIPFAILAMGLHAWQMGRSANGTADAEPEHRWQRRLRRLAVHCSLFLAVALAVSGWWYVRNATLYRDPFGLGTHLETWWAHEEPLSPSQIWAQLPSIERSFWGAFGWGNVHMPRVFYLAVRVVDRLALVGVLIGLLPAWRSEGHQRLRTWPLVLLALWVAVVFAALLRWMQLVEAALGRLLFPAIGSIAVLITWGLTRLSSAVSHALPCTADVSRRVSDGTLAALAGGLLCAAVAAPFVAIRPAYARPPLVSEDHVASHTAPANVRFGDTIRLVGFDLKHESVDRGDEAAITLCWKAVAPTRQDYAYFVHFLGPNETIAGARDTHPGLGRFPTSQWAPGNVFCDVVRVPVVGNAEVPAVYDVEIGWYDPKANRRLPAYGADGTPIELVTVAKIEILSEEQLTVDVPSRIGANLGDRVTLLGYGLNGNDGRVSRGQTVDVTLYWQAQSSVGANYTVFVHLSDLHSSPYAQDDGQPRGGIYPTSYWDVGQVVVDSHTLVVPEDLPPGRYPLVAGMYLLETGERVPAFDTEGARLPADAVPLTEIELLP